MAIDQKIQGIYDIEEAGVATPEEIRQYLGEQEREIRSLYKEAFAKIGEKTRVEKLAEADLKYGKFEVVRSDTYAEGIAKLKGQGRKPFIFSENIEARIADYEVNGEGAKLFKVWLDSVTGIAYKSHSTKFKLILRSDKLEDIKPSFNQSFMPVDYDAENGIEFDSKKGKYNQPLRREEAKDHEFWLVVMGGNKEKLVKYVDFWFDKTGKERGMGVYLRDNTGQDELRGLALDDDDYSIAYGYVDLYYYGYVARFVSGAQ